MAVEVIAVVAERLTQSMAVIQHRSYTVEAEAIEMELCKPELAVAQQEVNHLVLTVVEAETVPSRMFVTVARIEILVRIAGKIAKALNLVLHCMRMNDIHDNSNTILMSRIMDVPG